jgi:hypothetical protein
MLTPHRIETLVMRMQGAFLDKPSLKLSLPQAQMRFATDAVTAEAILDMLTDAGVLSKTPDGAYVRAMPRRPRLTHRAA